MAFVKGLWDQDCVWHSKIEDTLILKVLFIQSPSSLSNTILSLNPQRYFLNANPWSLLSSLPWSQFLLIWPTPLHGSGLVFLNANVITGLLCSLPFLAPWSLQNRSERKWGVWMVHQLSVWLWVSAQSGSQGQDRRLPTGSVLSRESAGDSLSLCPSPRLHSLSLSLR